MFKTKTVDSVISSLNQMVVDLGVVRDQQESEANKQFSIALEANEKKDVATAEAHRAASVTGKISDLIG